MRRPLLVAPFLISLAILSTALPVAARGPIAIGIANPAGGDLGVLDAHIAQVGGTQPRLWSLWSDWGGRERSPTCQPGVGNCSFPTDTVMQLHARGITPIIWWQPTNPSNPLQGHYERYKKTLNGIHDAYILEWIAAAKAAGQASGRPIILRYAHEATGYWFPWSVGRFDNTKELYKQAWRYLWRMFKREHALRYVKFMWSTVFPYKWAYPGDEYVDYVGVTVLNFGSPPRQWKDPEPLIDKRVQASKKITSKPIIIAEMATGYEGGDKANWLHRAYSRAYEKHRKIKGIVYLDTDLPFITAAQPDWRLVKPDDGSALQTYHNIAARPKFQGTIP